jgi:hypothetical protein
MPRPSTIPSRGLEHTLVTRPRSPAEQEPRSPVEQDYSAILGGLIR